MSMRRWRTRSIVVRAAVFLLLGAVVNVAVAWGCTRWSQFSTAAALNDSEAFHLIEQRELLSPERALDSQDSRGLGVRVQEVSVAGRTGEGASYAYVLVFDAGWPVSSLRAEWRGSALSPSELRNNITLISGRETSARTRDGQYLLGRLTLPTHSLWPGFAINTLFYAAILWLLFAAPGSVRRWRRIRRGLCAKCAYPVGGSDVCTECGAAVLYRKPNAKSMA